MQSFPLFVVLLCIISTFYVALAGPTFLPSLPANSTVQSSTPLRFAADQPIDPTSMLCTATGCTCNILGLSGLTATVTLSCSTEGLLPLVFTAADIDGNTGELSINYVYRSVGPVFGAHTPPNSPIKANTLLSFYANKPIQSSSILFTSPSCTLSSEADMNALTVTLVSCPAQGTNYITLSALDEHGNMGKNTFIYVYDSVGPIVGEVPDYTVKPGDSLDFFTNELIQPDPQFSVDCGGVGIPIVSGTNITVKLHYCTEADLSIVVTARDLAGNIGVSSIYYRGCMDGVSVYARPAIASYTVMKPSTNLLFTAKFAMDPLATVDIPGCQYDAPIVNPSTAVNFALVSCDHQGPFIVTVAVSVGAYH